MKKSNGIKLASVVFILAALTAAYFLTPLGDYLSIDKITDLTSSVPQNFATALIFLGIFFIGGSLLIPIPLMAFAVGLVFNIWISLLICIPGFLLASLSGYGVGKFIGVEVFGEKISNSLDKVKNKMDDKGAWAVLALRLAPTPPFTVTSIIGGSLDINIWKYAFGSTVGIMPLGLSAVFFGEGALQMMKEPSGLAATSIVAAIILFIVYRVMVNKQTEQ
ncbi:MULTISPECIES: TVP38/TMEM64 family protein [Alteromonadaceae]|uniref:TVP38/TMEM64 family protein n=1 Tax=Alteromonadaceae TaxID=72275 RepID=UPI001C09A618|nr:MULTISPECIES: VTT domain-containing protein [Aliiglaciecola]MBU2879599.1 VTT domain-containing protein [Aliiglaciecola lipolytica]MDO6710121.1 VTT domain-containing protein [Aliiglaciecola sp. 2_MG-2023]MDO6751269.1 VTT domain-containing protein [Aliiglaciecola sp. 1_MG-2023]